MTPRRRLVALVAMLPALAGCAVVEVRADGGRPRIGLYPLGVRVERGDARALSVSARTAGLWSGCAGAGAGLAAVDCDVIDVTACSAALVHARSNDPTLIGRLAGDTQALCPKPPQVKP